MDKTAVTEGVRKSACVHDVWVCVCACFVFVFVCVYVLLEGEK